MSLSKDLISQFVKATKDATTVKKESTVYGTVVKYNEKTYVKIDGSDLLTPAETLSSVEEGERVSIMIKDHTATITGNYTAPSASSIKVDGMNADLKANSANIKNLIAKNAEIENLVASKATIEDLRAANAEIDTLKSNYAEIETLVADKASIGDLAAVNADIKSLKADKADIAHLEANYATIGSLNAVYADVTRLEADKANITDLEATNAKITNLEANKADISVLQANYATIKQLDAANANITNLQTETANINNALIDKANVSDLTATNAKITDLQATKADVTELNAANANISTLTGNLAEITTLVNGNLTSDNIQSMVITGNKFTVENGFIKNAMIDSVNANKINAGVINTNNVKIQSNDGSMILQGNLQQFKDKNGKVRIQIGKDATGNFTFVLYDENGTGQLINQNGIQSSNAIADGLIVDSKVADNANIAGSKLDIESVVTEINDGTTTIKGTKIYLDDKKQTLDLAFNNLSTTVENLKVASGDVGDLVEKVSSNTTNIQIAQGQINTLISNTTITKENGEVVQLKDEYNATKNTVNSHSTKIGSLETNLATANNNISSVSSKQTALEQNLNGFKQTVSQTYATKAALNTVDGKFANYSTTSAMNSAINQKGDSILSTVSSTYATKSALNTVDGKFANYSTTSAMNSAINQKSDAILSTVSNTYTTKSDFNGLTVGGTNLLLKTKTFDIAGGLNKTGEIYRGLVVRGINSIPDTATYICEYGFTDFDYNDIFTFSFYAKGNLTNLCAYFYGDGGYVPAYLIENSVGIKANGSGDGYSPFGKITSEWKRYWVTWQVAGSGNKSITKRILLRTDGSNVGESIYICGCKFERGNKATEWTPAPEDIDASIATVDNKFANYSTTSQMNSAINQKANEITSTVSETYATKNALTSVDNKFANYSTTTAMNSAINQKGDSILSTVSNTYATKTTVTDLSNNLKNNYSTTTAMNTAINQKSDAILSTVSSTYTTKSDFNKLSIGGTNLLTGTRNFDDGWFYDGFALQNGQYDGTFKGCYINWTGTSGYKDVGKNNSVYLEPNTEYTLSFWARGNGKFWSYLYTPNKVVVASGYNSSGASTTSPDGAIVNTLTDNDIFKRYWITWKTASNLTPGKYNVIPCRVASDLGNCHMVICGVKIEKGNKATAWTPAPQDVDSAISAVDNKFTSYSTTQQMNSAINQKANEITSTVSETYATKTDLNTANGNISSLTNRMQSAESKLTKDSLTTTIGNYYTTSTDVNNLVTAKGYATTSQVSQTATDLTAKFKSTGGINLIRNSTAIGGLNGWQGNMSYSEADSVGKVTGNRRFFYINNKNTTENYAFSPRFALKANTTYCLSCWIYRNTTSTGYDIFVLSSTSLPWTDTSTSFNNVYHMHAGSATGWERVEKTFTTGADDISGYVRIDNNGYSGSGDANVANIHFGSLMLTEGTIAHPWTPHPSECYSGITQIDGQGIKVMHDSIDSNSYTHMSPTGFYLKNKGTDIFKVDGNGLYIKGNGEFTGKITSTSGAIGGYTISDHIIKGTNVGMSSLSGSDYAFWAGASTGGSAPFRVGHDGSLTATQATITGDITANNGSIGGFTISSGKLVGNGGNGVGMSGNGTDWAFWAGSNTGGNAPFHVGHEGNLYATQAYITGTITGSTINAGTINGATINSDSFVGDVLAIDGTISAKSLQVEDIDNAKYPGVVTADFKLYVSTSGNDDSEIENGATFATFDALLDKLPKNLNGHEVRIEMSTNITENVDFKGFFGGKIRLYMKGHTLYGYVVSRMGSARINICSGYIGNASDTSNGWGKIHPSKGYAVSSYTTTVASVDQGAIGLYNIDVYGADNYLSGSTTKLGVAGQDWGTAYLNGVSYYGCDIGARANAGGRIHDVLSYNVCTKYGFYATTGGYITLAGSEHSGGKSKNYHEADAGKVIVASGATFAGGEVSVPGGTAPVVPTTKTITIKSTYGDTYRSSVYNSWKKDGTARQGDYGYGDCNGCWFFGDAFSDLEGKTINKVTIKITRQSGGSSSAVGLVVKSHGYSGRPSGAPSYRTTAGTLSLATGASGTLTITNSTILSEISSGAVKGFGIQSTYNSANYAVCSGSVTVKITYTE